MVRVSYVNVMPGLQLGLRRVTGDNAEDNGNALSAWGPSWIHFLPNDSYSPEDKEFATMPFRLLPVAD